MITIIPATEEHARMIAPRIQVGPRYCSLWRAKQQTTEDIALDALRRSTSAWSGFADGEIGGMCGVIPESVVSHEAFVWLLPTDLVRKHAVPFLRASRQWVAEMRELHPNLYGYVDRDNRASISWLQWLGFNVGNEGDFLPFKVAGHG